MENRQAHQFDAGRICATGFSWWMKAVFPVRIIGKVCAAIASRVPVGYEDEAGFHYGRNAEH